jgi:glycosyltransferase involved in cell wall biosynthesis
MLAAVPQLPPPPKGARPVIGVLGNIGPHKGAAVLADLSRRLARSGQADLVLIGNLDPAYRLARPAQIHGSYRIAEIPALAARYGITCWLMPSVWPETFSFATHEVLATGLPVYCFDLGAQGEAVRRAIDAGAPGAVIPLPPDRGEAVTAILDHVLSRRRARPGQR